MARRKQPAADKVVDQALAQVARRRTKRNRRSEQLAREAYDRAAARREAEERRTQASQLRSGPRVSIDGTCRGE
jgi:hypothetical protein